MRPHTVHAATAAACAVLSSMSLIGPGPAHADPGAALLSYGEINQAVAQYSPQTPPFWNSDPVRHQPDAPYDGWPAPCGQVLPLYFGGGEPQYSSYVSSWTIGAGNVFVGQLVASYATAAQAATKFTQLSEAIPACASALTHDPDATLTVEPGAITPDSARFEQRQTGKNAELPDWHNVAVEYQGLAGASLIGVSSSQSAPLVSAIVRELRGRVHG